MRLHAVTVLCQYCDLDPSDPSDLEVDLPRPPADILPSSVKKSVLDLLDENHDWDHFRAFDLQLVRIDPSFKLG